MRTTLQDLRYALRMLRRTPGFALVAVLTLGLGIGAATAIFSIISGVLVRPLSYREPARVVDLWVDFGVGAQSLPAMSPGDFKDYQQRTQLFESIGAASGGGLVGATGALGEGENVERVDVSTVTANFFQTVGVDPLHGRHFTAEEEATGGPNVVILSHRLWVSRFAADQAIVGRRIRLDGLDQTVVGVLPATGRVWLPAEAFLVTDAQIWKPLQFNYANQPPRNFTFFTVFGRMKPGVTLAQAQTDLETVAAQLRREHAVHESAGMRIRAVALQDDVVKHVRPALVALFGAVGMLLLIACANVAHLLLARATARERELAVRGALGASRGRLLRQLTTESLLLAAGGGSLGVFLAWLGTRWLVWMQPANLPRVEAITIDWRVLVFALGASIATALLFGLIPALRAAGIDVNRTLRAGASPSASRAQVRMRSVLMVAEVALTLVLLIGAGLMVRSFAALQQIRPGFDAASVLTFRVSLPVAKYSRFEMRAEFIRRMEEELRRLPGVTYVGVTSQLPLTGSGSLSPFAYDEATARNWESATADGRGASPDYFRALGTRLLAGRFFEERDRGANVIIIDKTLAARAWPGENAVGRRLQVQPTGSPNAFAEVVGVIEHIRSQDLARAVRPQLFRPLIGFGGTQPFVVVRTTVDPASLITPVRHLVAAMDPDAPVDRAQPLSVYVGDALAQSKLTLVLMAGFGLVALIMAAVGIYGVISYSVSQRTREIGIRMALGQETWQIRNLVVGQGLRLVGISLVIGLAAAYALTTTVSGLLYRVNPRDPLTFAGMAVFLLVVALVGCLVPARRATAVTPLSALKAE
ncbi:MAG: ABC transporter permease [Vicinamibacterales bacterium]